MNCKPFCNTVVITRFSPVRNTSGCGSGARPDRGALSLADILAITGLLGITIIALASGFLLFQSLHAGGLASSSPGNPDSRSQAGNTGTHSESLNMTPAGQDSNFPETEIPESASLVARGTPNPTDDSQKNPDQGAIYRTYSWSFRNATWSWQGNFSEASYDYYRGKPHNRENNYAEYALSDYDRHILSDIVTKFKNVGRANGFSEYDNVMNIAAFVQSLHYSSDKVTTGYDEYPRYPIETLVENGGDCEDTSILAAALISQMGYGVVLIKLPGHMAIGVKGSDAFQGTYFESGESRYYYLETTSGAHWDLGELPREFRNAPVTLLPLVQRARMDMTCGEDGATFTGNQVFLNENCTIRNIGVGTAMNSSLYVAALGSVGGKQQVWPPDTNLPLGDYPEGASGSASAVVRIPVNQTTRVRFYLYGDNFDPVDLLSDPMKT